MAKSSGSKTTRGKKKADTPNFEKDLEALEGVVEALEEGGLSLEESLAKFEAGIALSKRCETALSAAEKKIEILTKDASGALKAEPFGDDEEEQEEEEDEEPEEEDDEESDGEMLF